MQDRRTLLREMFDAAVAAADPAIVVPAHLPALPKGRTIVVGAGKASAAMARAFERAWPASCEGLVVTRYGHAVACDRITVVEAAHPVPDEAGTRAAARMLELVSGLQDDDLVVALISGGGSALLTLPAAGLTLADKQAVNRALLRSGANIEEMNCVRKHLSAIKGGRLAAAAFPARLEALVISDVPGDDPATIASGPTVPDPSTYHEALEILTKYGIREPTVITHVERATDETPKPGDPRLVRSGMTLIATPQQSLEAAAAIAEKAGFKAVVLGDSIEGEAREVAKVMAGIARQVIRHQQPAPAPLVLLSGGETTVTIRGDGRGGRNVEFLLALAIESRNLPNLWALAADTDGIDGAEEVAGGVITPSTLARADQLGMKAKEMLARNDAHPFLAKLQDQIVTGPTLTNVNDFRAILIDRG